MQAVHADFSHTTHRWSSVRCITQPSGTSWSHAARSWAKKRASRSKLARTARRRGQEDDALAQAMWKPGGGSVAQRRLVYWRRDCGLGAGREVRAGRDSCTQVAAARHLASGRAARSSDGHYRVMGMRSAATRTRPHARRRQGWRGQEALSRPPAVADCRAAMNRPADRGCARRALERRYPDGRSCCVPANPG